jgi:hypothetical protein
MEIDLNVLGKQQVESTSGTKQMRMSEHAQSMVFQMFTKNVYSNPIGTVVREITSNCFDSHVEAGVKNIPVLIKKTHDPQTDTYYISFIDYGVGMSPDRVENVYGVYFESTKRKNNNEIGGFGIGGKTPLAYKRYTGDGEGEYDNSFFVITNYNGIKYYYNVYEGKASPEYTLFHKEETNERNGTEIRIPVLFKDIDKFEDELVRQLYYFEGIIFEGFSEKVENDYQIVEGENFYYRGDQVDHKMHVCLGKVYYPIDFSTLGLSWFDYEVPVAIKVPIGKIGVTVSRESLDYSEQTVTYLKKRIDDVMTELKSMLTKQYDNVRTLEDYFELKNNFGVLHLTDNKSLRLNHFIDQKDIDLSKFKYSMFKTPSSGKLYDLFFDTKVYGKKETKSAYRDEYQRLERNYNGIKSADNLFYSDSQDFRAKRIKQSYLRNEYGRFYLIRKTDISKKWDMICQMFNVHFDTKEDFQKSTTFKNLLEMQEEYFNIVRENAQEYESVEIPEDFKMNYGREKLSTEILKTTIPVKMDNWRKERVKIQDLVDFKGKIFYGVPDDEQYAFQCRGVFEELFNKKYLATDYNKYRKNNKFGDKKGMMIITLAKNNLKYMKYCKNAHPIDQFYTKIVKRKEDDALKQLRNYDLRELYSDISTFYRSDFFKEFAPEWGKKMDEIQSLINTIEINRDIRFHKEWLKQHIDQNKLQPTDQEKNVRQYIAEFEELENKNQKAFKFVDLPFRIDNLDEDEKQTLKSILEMVMSF